MQGDPDDLRERHDVDEENPAGEDIMEREGGVHQPSTEPPPLSPLGALGL